MLDALAIAAPLVLAGERSFFHVPQAAEVRVQRIARADNERDWPFSVDEGNLTCVWSVGQKLVFFFEKRPRKLGQDDDFERARRHRLDQSGRSDASATSPTARCSRR